MPALQAFVSTHPSLFCELVMIDKSIMDDIFKELKAIDAILMERDDKFTVVEYISSSHN